MSDIIALVFFALLANANDFVSIEVFGKEHGKFLGRYLELANGIPSHDTIQRVFAMVSPEFLQGFQVRWEAMLNSEEGEKVKRLLPLMAKHNGAMGIRSKEQIIP
jgi:hypothetical protein